MELEQRIEEQIASAKTYFEKYKAEGKRMFATSSFQTHSIPMLHVMAQIDNSIPVAFINTGYHFPETVAFRDQICGQFGLEFIDVKPLVPKNQQRDENGNLYFTSDPDLCCHINKTQSMEPVLAKMDVWVNGIRADQNANRRGMNVEEQTPNGTVRFHPMLHWDNKMIYRYIKIHNLPPHPLEAKGYLSIGCEPCTRKFDFSNSREGRWFGMKKQECGLHTDLVKK